MIMSFENEANLTKTLDETDRKCPNCGGVMDYDAATKGLKCPYCDYEEEILLEDDSLTTAEENMLDLSMDSKNCDWGVEKKTIICEACGAESIYDSVQISAVCPYCGSNHVTEANTQDTIAPGGVVPFSITDKESSDLFKKWIKRKWFCPKLAKESAKPDKFNGIYLPYWTFDATTSSHYSARYGIEHTTGTGENRRTVTRWYSTSGVYKENFDDELVLASDNYDTKILSKIEPFDTAKNKPYKPEYIAGYVAQRYSTGLKDAWERAKKSISNKIRSGIDSQIRTKHHADDVSNILMQTSYNDLTYKYLLLPIWTSSFKYQDKVYHFMVNGQTGKVAGKTPISPIRVALAVVAGIICLGIIYAMMY